MQAHVGKRRLIWASFGHEAVYDAQEVCADADVARDCMSGRLSAASLSSTSRRTTSTHPGTHDFLSPLKLVDCAGASHTAMLQKQSVCTPFPNTQAFTSQPPKSRVQLHPGFAFYLYLLKWGALRRGMRSILST